MRQGSFFAFSILLLISCNSYSLRHDVREITAKKLYNLIIKNEPIVIVDLRTNKEFSEGHIPLAINIDYYSHQLDALLSNLPKDKTIICYCSHGLRSKNVAMKLKSKGYMKVMSLYGGLSDWIKRGYPIEKGQD